MITNRAFVNYLNDCNYDFIEVRDGKPLGMSCLDMVTIRLNTGLPDRKDNLMTVGSFGRKDNKVEVNFLGLMDLWDIDEVEVILKAYGLKKQI